jgi:hypothetical protein
MNLIADELSAIFVIRLHWTNNSNLDEDELRKRAKSVVSLVMSALSVK